MKGRTAIIIGCVAVPVVLALGVGMYGLIAFVVIKAIKAALQ